MTLERSIVETASNQLATRSAANEVRKIKRLNRWATVINALGLAAGLALMTVYPALAVIFVILSILVYALLRNWAGRMEEELEGANPGDEVTLSEKSVEHLADQIARRFPGGTALGNPHSKPEKITYRAELTNIRAEATITQVDAASSEEGADSGKPEKKKK